MGRITWLLVTVLNVACNEHGLPAQTTDGGLGDLAVRADLAKLDDQAGRIACGDKVCDFAGRGEICCQDFNNVTSCTTADLCHVGVIACDGNEDCAGAQCCGIFGEWDHTACSAPCMQRQVCRSAADCPAQAPFCCRTYVAFYCGDVQQGFECR